jgi:flavodoxin
MRVEIFHASKFGNGAKVAEELRRQMEAKGHQASVRHIDDSKPKELPPADLYVFGSPTRFGGPIGSMKRFAKKAVLPQGARYAVFATHGDAVPDRKTGKMPTEKELCVQRKTIPILDEIFAEKGLVKVADKIFLVSPEEMKGHLRDGWQGRVDEFTAAILR